MTNNPIWRFLGLASTRFPVWDTQSPCMAKATDHEIKITSANAASIAESQVLTGLQIISDNLGGSTFTPRIALRLKTFIAAAMLVVVSLSNSIAYAACSTGIASTPVTVNNETSNVPNSRQLVNGRGSAVDTTVAGQIKLNISAPLGVSITSYSAGGACLVSGNSYTYVTSATQINLPSNISITPGTAVDLTIGGTQGTINVITDGGNADGTIVFNGSSSNTMIALSNGDQISLLYNGTGVWFVTSFVPQGGTGSNHGSVWSVAQGGTGASASPANGQIPIGNGTSYAPANLTAGTGITISNGPGSITINATGSGSGSVTSFSSGNLNPLFTTSVANPTTTPALSFSLSNAAANSWFGNAGSSSAAPSFNTTAMPASMGGTGSMSVPANGQIPIGNGTGYTPATLTAGTGISISNGSGSITINANQSSGTAQSFNARLTAVTGTAVPTTDQTSVTAVYLTAYHGNSVSLYNGTNWVVDTLSSDASLSLSGYTAGTVYVCVRSYPWWA